MKECETIKLNSLKIKTDNEHPTVSKVIINGVDVSNQVCELSLKLGYGEMPTALIEVPFDDIELEGNFEVLKAIPKEDNNFNISINTPKDMDVSQVAEEVVKKIAADFNKSSYR